MSGDSLVERLAAALYDRSISGTSHSEAPPWMAAGPEIRDRWRELAGTAVAMVREADRRET